MNDEIELLKTKLSKANEEIKALEAHNDYMTKKYEKAAYEIYEYEEKVKKLEADRNNLVQIDKSGLVKRVFQDQELREKLSKAEAIINKYEEALKHYNKWDKKSDPTDHDCESDHDCGCCNSMYMGAVAYRALTDVKKMRGEG